MAQVARMTNQNSKTWLCPLCAQARMAYGTTCEAPSECGNVPHLTGEKYLNADGTHKVLSDVSAGVGISEISNEGSDDE